MAKKISKGAIHPELSGKALKALNKLNKGLDSYLGLQKVLKKVYDIIKTNIGTENNSSFPERIKFSFAESLDFNFYIDFTVSPSGGENPWDLEGNILYGVYNKNKFDYRDEEKCEICGGKILCHCVRTRSLLSLTVNEYGFIQSSDKLEENWILKLNTNDPLSVKEDTKIVMEIHYKALEYIFLEALSFINEKYKNL
jgi:hypothetical protein